MERTCRQCKKFNPWAVAMVIMDDAKICKADVWRVQEGMFPEELEDMLKTAARCTHFEPRAR
jgi:hypothetical protein